MFSKISTAQSGGVSDTLAYLHTIVANKAQYIGQPFSVLYSALQIQIKFFNPNANLHYDKTKETSTAFSFYFPKTADEIYLAYPMLQITWQFFLDAVLSNILYTQHNGGGWGTAVYNFYKNAIIADITIRQ